MIAGWDNLLSWFEGHSSFHDAEILEIHLDRAGDSYIRLHWWVMRREVDDRGYYILDKHAIVTFHLHGISDLNLLGFNHQNVIFGLHVQTGDEGIRLEFEPCYGISGAITAKEVIVEVVPEKPSPKP